MRTILLRGGPREAIALRCRLLLGPVLVAALWAQTESAGATGFFVNQQSVRGLGRVDAGNTAAADELGTIFFNPAGLSVLWSDGAGDNTRVSWGVQVIIPRSTQQNAGSTAATLGTLGLQAPYAGSDSSNPTSATPIPNLYFARRLSESASVGVGVNVPFGLGVEFNKDWYGRYDATEASLRTINLSVVAAYRVDDRLSIGGGIDGQYARTTLASAIPNPLMPGGPTAETDGRISTVGHTYTPGFNLGLLYSFDEHNRVGFHYRSGMKHHIHGSAEVSSLTGPLAAFNGETGARADLKLPAIATVGARWRISRDWVVLGEAAWYDWSKFDEVRIRFADGRADGVRPANYRDAYGVAVGAEHRRSGSPLTLRGGLHYDTTPTVDAYRDTTVPDSERLWLGLGATYAPTRHFECDVAINHVFFRQTRIALTRTFFDNTPLASEVRINATVRTVVNTVAIDLRWRF